MGSIPTTPEIILFDYQFAPNAQKARNLLTMCNIPYKQCEQPFVLPRPTLTDLGITYRRIPVNCIGKDVYCDNRTFLEAVQTLFPDRALPVSSADHAFESFGYRTFWASLPLVPVELNSKALQDDRKDLFTVFGRPDFAALRPGALAELKHFMDIVEKDFLGSGPWIGGSKCSVADIHASWMIKWGLQTMGVAKEPGFSKEDFPKVHRWVEGLPLHTTENDAEKLSAEEAKKRLLAAGYAAPDIGVDHTDPYGFKAGQKVAVETNDDASPGNTQQLGKLVGLDRRQVVIELDNGLRLHFPKIGSVLKVV